MELAEEALKDIISPNDKREVTPELVIQVVADHYGITPSISVPRNGTRKSSIRARLSCTYAARLLERRSR